MFDYTTANIRTNTGINAEFARKLEKDVDRAAYQLREETARKKARELRGKSCREVLADLLAQIVRVDFRERAGLDDDARLARKTFVVVAVSEIIGKATSNDWGLCMRNGFTYLYNGRYWQALDIDTLKVFLAEAAVKMGVPEMEASYYQFRDELYKQFSAMANMPTPEPGEGVTLINLRNGTFEISDQGPKLREYRREDFLKYQLPFDYDPSARCPMFDRYLQRVLPDESCRKVLSEYLGYVFTTHLKLEKVAILYGSGANGKSVFFDIVQALIGKDNICTYSLQNLTSPTSYERASLANKLLNYATEINGRLEASIFKQLASGEPVAARQIYGQPFIMERYAKLLFNCNELPRDVENTNAFFRRFLIIPFTQTIPESEQDPQLSRKIIASELSGIFNWMLDGLHRLLLNGRFTAADAVIRQVEEFRKESDSVAMFLDDEGYRPHLTGFVRLKSLYQEYQTYCSDNGYAPCSLRTVSSRLKNNGYTVGRKTFGSVVYLEKAAIES